MFYSIFSLSGCCDHWDIKTLKASHGISFLLDVIPSVEWMDISNFIEGKESIYIADTLTEAYDTNSIDEDFENKPELVIPNLDYTSVQYDLENGLVLIIGGETGLSLDAKSFTLRKNGLRITIPQHFNMNSLNSSAAMGIIVYEIMRQNLEKLKE